jgi:hypothetical protein
LKPDSPKADQFEGESTIYVDDFEGSQSTIDMFGLCLESFFHSDRNVRSTYDFNANANDLSMVLKELNWLGILRPCFLYPKPAELQITTVIQ